MISWPKKLIVQTGTNLGDQNNVVIYSNRVFGYKLGKFPLLALGPGANPTKDREVIDVEFALCKANPRYLSVCFHLGRL